MKAILIHRHPDCARCARIARAHHLFDWLDRVEDTTEPPRSGPLRMGEVIVEDLRTGGLHGGAEAFGLICRQIPLYAPARVLLRFPAFRRRVDLDMGGCDDGACGVPTSGQAQGRAARED
jgi:hypothetical protein